MNRSFRLALTGTPPFFFYEEVYLSEYQVFEDAMLNSVCFIEDVYNAKRLHSSLGYVPPNEFEETWLKQESLIHQTNKIEKTAMV